MFKWLPLLLSLLLLQRCESASQECVDLLPEILEACPAFEYAKSNDLSLSVTKSDPPVRRQDGSTEASFMVQALDKIKAQNYDETCCGFLSKVNASRCFCEEDVVQALQSEMEEELLAFTLFTAARPLPGGCGGSIWAALDGEQCLPLGPMSDADSVTTGCQSLSQVLRDPRNVRDSIKIFSEALDATDLIDTLEDMDVVTIFAPTDTAFLNLAEDLGVSVSDLLTNDKVLLPILQQHVIQDGLIKSSDVTGSIPVETLNKNELLLDTTSSGGVTVDGIPITQADIDICNGVLHAISTVLFEFPDGEPKLTTEEPASPIVVSGSSDTEDEDEDEDVETDETTQETEDETSKVEEEEEEEEENAAGESCDDNLFSLLVSFEEAFGLLINELEEVEDVKAILLGPELEVERIINGETSLEDTDITLRRLVVEGDVEGESLEPGTILTTLGGEKIEATSSSGNIMINGVSVIQADIEACNGRLFIIEAPLPALEDIDGVDEKAEEKEEEEEDEDGEEVEEKEEAGKDEEGEEDAKVEEKEEDEEGEEDKEVEEDETDEEVPSQAPLDGTPMAPSEDADEDSETTSDRTSESMTESEPATPPSSQSTATKPAVEETPTKPMAPTPSEPATNPVDDDPRRLVIKGADSEDEEQADATEETSTMPIARIESIPDACGCSATGVSAGVETSRPGCGQHLLDLGETTIFCYIEDPDACFASDKFFEMSPSIKFAPGYWKTCEKDEITALPTLAELLGEKLDSLNPVWRIFVYAELDTVLQRDGPFTVLVPSRLAVAGALTESLLDGSSSDNRGLKKIMKRHIIKGEFTEEDLRSTEFVTTIDGEKLGIRLDNDGAVLIGGAVSIEVADMLATNGVAHIVDDFIVDNLTTERTVSLEEACACSLDGFSGNVATGRPGCDTHIIGEAPFCYVQHPAECHLATDSQAFEGAKWMPCKDPCTCSYNGISGGIDTGRPGCARHVMGTSSFCYVIGPDQCKYSSASEGFEGAAWKWCESLPALPVLIPGSTPVENDPCACAEDGVSGGVITGKRGCGRHGVLFAVFNTCYVRDPANCHRAMPSLRCNGAGWRFC